MADSVIAARNTNKQSFDPTKEHFSTGFPPIKAMNTGWLFSPAEVERLRTLAQKVAEIATLPKQQIKRELWRRHNDLETSQPLVFIDPETGWNECITSHDLFCIDPMARTWEMHLLKLIYWNDVLKDDKVIEDVFEVHYSYSDTGWGLEIIKEGGENNGAYHIVKSLVDYNLDFPKLHYPEIIIDEDESARVLELANSVFDGILKVQRRPVWWWSFGMTVDYIMFRGLEDFLCDMIAEPEYFHKTMDLMCNGILKKLDFLESKGLLALNTGAKYVGSGGFGFTKELPDPCNPPDKVCTKDMWGFVESQETSCVSPEMYGEFVLPYHKKVAEKFGLNCYGCCESVTMRWEYVRQIPRLRRVSFSPWSDWEQIRDTVSNKYIASIKPPPMPLAMPNMDETLVRSQLRKALDCSRDCIPELVINSTTTLGNNPGNAARWVELAREEIDNT